MKIPNLIAVLVAGSCSVACAYHNPTAPTRDTTPTSGTPASLTLSATSGTGTNGGTAHVDAMVRDGQFAAVPGVTVAFTAASGTISGEAITNDKGIASATLTAAPGSVLVTASLGAIQSTALVAVQVPTTPPPTLPPPPTTQPPPDPGPLSISLRVTGATLGDQNVFSITAKNPSGPITVAWVFGDGTVANSTSPTTAHRYAAVGTYTASATLRDDAGRSASASTPVTVFAVVPPPAPIPFYTVSVTAAPTSVASGGTSTLTATATASNGAPSPTSFAWDCNGDGTIDATTAGNSTVCTYSTVGTTTSTVTVTGGSASGFGSTTVTVTALTAPTLAISCSAGVHVGSASICVASATVGGVTVPATAITQVSWNFGDSTVANNVAGNVSPSHTFPTAAAFTVFGTATITGVTGTVTGSTTTTILP